VLRGFVIDENLDVVPGEPLLQILTRGRQERKMLYWKA
jgi:hypothetical protein